MPILSSGSYDEAIDDRVKQEDVQYSLLIYRDIEDDLIEL